MVEVEPGARASRYVSTNAAMPCGIEESGDVVPFVIHPQLAMAAAGHDDDGGAR